MKMINFAHFHTNKAEEGYFKATQAVSTVIEFREIWFYLEETMSLFLNWALYWSDNLNDFSDSATSKKTRKWSYLLNNITYYKI